MTDGPIIQVAGILDRQEAVMLCDSGVTHLGFPLRLAFHREDLTDSEAREIIRMLPKHISKVLITYLTDPPQIVELARYLGTDTVQLHARPGREVLTELRRLAPDLGIIRSLIIGVSSPDAIAAEARSLADLVDFFLTDTYDPKTGATGATGKTHDWEVSRFLARELDRGLILAGGLTPLNVGQAILKVKPAGVDAHTGVEGPGGRKDWELVRAFVREALAGFQ